MPKNLERMGEGLAKHLHLTLGGERYNAVKYGTMRSHGWAPGKRISKAAGEMLHSK